MKAHTLEGNVKVRTFAPPLADFDPLKATKAELVKHGFPVVPESREHRELYRRLFQQMKGKFQYVEPSFGKPRKDVGGNTTWRLERVALPKECRPEMK